MRLCRRFITLSTVLLLSSCVTYHSQTTQSPAVVTSLPTQPLSTEPTNEPVVTSERSPVVTPEKRTVIPAVDNMVRLCEQSLSARQWPKAIAYAERGLRMDRKEPRFYWTLAVAYQQLNNVEKSKRFANQGLRYANQGSPVARDLTRLAGE